MDLFRERKEDYAPAGQGLDFYFQFPKWHYEGPRNRMQHSPTGPLSSYRTGKEEGICVKSVRLISIPHSYINTHIP